MGYDGDKHERYENFAVVGAVAQALFIAMGVAGVGGFVSNTLFESGWNETWVNGLTEASIAGYGLATILKWFAMTGAERQMGFFKYPPYIGEVLLPRYTRMAVHAPSEVVLPTSLRETSES